MAISDELKKAELKIRTKVALPVKKARREMKESKLFLIKQYSQGLITEYEFVKTMSFKMLPPQC